MNKRIITAILVAAMLAATVSGCGEDTESKPQTSSSQQSSSQTESSSSTEQQSSSSSEVESSSSTEENSSSSTEESSSSQSSSSSSSSSKPQSSSSSSSTPAEDSEAPASDFSYVYVEELGGIQITKYKGKSATVKIPSTINGKKVVKIGDIGTTGLLTGVIVYESAFNSTYVKNVIIPSTVTEIETNAFQQCKALESITIPASVTSIGSNVFIDCNALASINVDKNNKNYCSNNDALYDKNMTELMLCSRKKSGSFSIPNGVTTIRTSAFEMCENLASITIPDSVTSIENMAFSGCKSLTSVTIPDSVTKISGNAFDNCENIQATYKGKTYSYSNINELYKAING